MAEVTEDFRRVRVGLTTQEMNTLLIQPAKNAGFIDFDPTRIDISQNRDGFLITFERVEASDG